MNGTDNGSAPANGGMPQRRAYSVPEVAELLGGVTERFVWTLVARGDLESVKIGARRVVPAEALDAFMDKLRAEERAARAAAGAR